MRVGFIINPVAGMGGKVALKGTDGEDALRRAVERGAVPVAGQRAETAVRQFADAARDALFLTPSGEMGEALLSKYGLKTEIIRRTGDKTGPEDTREAAAAVLEKGADLLVFAGGDGTARDICSVVGVNIPVTGIPAGVKIHSGVYANKPTAAGALIKRFLQGKIKKFTEAEVMDIDEGLFRENIVNAKLYGYMLIPDDREFMQDRKTGGAGPGSGETDAVAAWAAGNMDERAVYLIGPGSTTARVMEQMGLKPSLLGVDAVSGGKILASDMAEDGIAALLAHYERKDRYLVITPMGGQGHIFGRGNQQLSPRVLRMLPKENVIVIAAPSKMAQLFGKPLISDTGDTELDAEYGGYMPVAVGCGKKIMVKVI